MKKRNGFADRQKNEGFDHAEFNEKPEKVEKCEDAITIGKEIERFIESQNQNITCLAYSQGWNLIKFKELRKFSKMVKEPGISKSNIMFKN